MGKGIGRDLEELYVNSPTGEFKENVIALVIDISISISDTDCQKKKRKRKRRKERKKNTDEDMLYIPLAMKFKIVLRYIFSHPVNTYRLFR